MLIFMMAEFVINLNHHMKLCHVLGLFFLLFLMKCINATEFKVGGSNGWTAPTNQNALNYNQWAQKNRFQVGDSIVFVYSSEDSLLQVTREDYEKCNTEKPIRTFKDGHTTIKFYESGSHYYLSGNRANCLKNEKLVVLVMAYRGSSSGTSSQILSFIGGAGALLSSILPLVM
ncbi:hypothetical protein IFM89_020607 [Coptis chinensis]|uniref:Phytocyanin domain-containing protein n=1 Tax=Coptis chinensis TaxID=261450 RepID=A0A835I1X8_9MAGN|nr:hypothetical protein IFM89_020607 [Coptis chinensis]